MDIKSYFLRGYINEEVYISKPPTFEDHENSGYVFKLKRVICGLKQVPRSWYEHLSGILIK